MNAGRGRTHAADRSGLLIVDKPQGVTSHDVVAAVRSVLHVKRVGHAGTLDPMATGVLVVGFGHATRLLNAIVEHEKVYEATIRLGISTTTDDAEGDIVLDQHVVSCEMLDRQRITDVIRSRFVGTIDQVPSTFSAVKIDGHRAYDLARAGKTVELPARTVTVTQFDTLDMRRGTVSCEGVDHHVIDLDVVVACSAGTYIRALARDLGAVLGTGGHLTRLRRTRVGAFTSDAERVVHVGVSERRYTNREGIETTRNRAVVEGGTETLLAKAMPMIDAVRMTMATVGIDEGQARDLRYGRQIELAVGDTTAAYLTDSNEVIALLSPAGENRAKPVVVFPAEERTATVDAATTI